MRVLLSVYGSRGDVQPLLGLAVALRDLGAEVQMCAPPDDDYAELFARVGVPVVPVGPPIRSIAPPSSSDALKTALTRQTRARATAVAGKIRTDGAMVAARLLLDRSEA
jgi:vancomycin aglycone glucosyltransferase